MTPLSLEQIISQANGAGWEFLEGLPDDIRRRLEVKKSESEHEARAIARAWADFYQTPGGAKALEHLFGSTLRRTVFFVNLGQEPLAMGVFGAFREGQNALAQEIARQINKGLAEPTEPRDVT